MKTYPVANWCNWMLSQQIFELEQLVEEDPGQGVTFGTDNAGQQASYR